jgi:hypothetical protein
MFSQNRADVLLEELEASLGWLGGGLGGDGETSEAHGGKERQVGEGNVHGQRRSDEGLNSDPRGMVPRGNAKGNSLVR